ncbi:MAG TPA: class I SAM-dependent methyltransferase [Rhodanobacteraceae bacterium]
MFTDPFERLKFVQRAGWAVFAPLEAVTIMPAAELIRFARVRSGQRVLDAGCGTGVVAVTAARMGTQVWALDLSPELLEHGKAHAFVAALDICFKEGDVEALPYETGTFDVVLSQFGHMFAPRHEVALAEMLRVLKPGGTIAFSTWPPENFVGEMFQLISSYLPPAQSAVPATLWGDPRIVRERLGDVVDDIVFDRGVIKFPALSPQHYRHTMEKTLGPMVKLLELLKGEPTKLAIFRSEFDALVSRHLSGNIVREHFLMTRAIKRP